MITSKSLGTLEDLKFIQAYEQGLLKSSYTGFQQQSPILPASGLAKTLKSWEEEESEKRRRAGSGSDERRQDGSEESVQTLEAAESTLAEPKAVGRNLAAGSEGPPAFASTPRRSFGAGAEGLVIYLIH